MFLCYSARQSNLHHQSTSDSRTDFSFQTCRQHRVLSFWFLCNSLIYKLLLSTRPPSNSDQSDHFYTAAEDRHQTCLDDQDMIDPPSHMSPSCICQTVWVLCILCLDPVWARRNLMERTRHNTAAVIDLSSVWWWHHLHPQQDVNEWCHSLKFALFSWIKWKTHLHFLRPGVNHRTPAGCSLKGGGGVRAARSLSTCKHGRYIALVYCFIILI